MRTVVLILMIALLPLRMWAAEGMAVRMAQQQAAAAMQASETASMPDDCPMMMAAAKADPGSQDEPASAAHCMSCHLCAATACWPELAFEPSPVPAGPPESRVSRYASADLARDLRPPIA